MKLLGIAIERTCKCLVCSFASLGFLTEAICYKQTNSIISHSPSKQVEHFENFVILGLGCLAVCVEIYFQISYRYQYSASHSDLMRYLAQEKFSLIAKVVIKVS